MRDVGRVSLLYAGLSAKDRLRALASRQFGVVARRQLTHLGVCGSVIDNWVVAGDVHRIHRGVYAVGHTALSTEGELTAAVLLAGPDAMLSHGTAAWWLRLTNRRPAAIHVCTPRRCAPQPGIAVHGRRRLEREWHRGIPVAPVAEVLLGFAATERFDDLRYVLAQAEYHGLLDLDALNVTDRPGSAALRAALERHQPQLAHTRSEFERRLIRLCEAHGLPVPTFNAWIAGWLADAVWHHQRVVVELDGREGHAGWARIRADHARDLALRAAGWVVLRYTWEQLEGTPGDVAQDIGRALAAAISR